MRRRLTGLPDAWRLALVAVLVLRVAIAILSVAFGGMLPGLDPVSVEDVPGTSFDGWVALAPEEQGFGLLGASLERFDALWYLSIASDGYPSVSASGDVPGAAAFFPLFPLLVGVLGRILFGHFYLAGSLVAFVAAVTALAGVHRLVEEETGDAGTARRAVIAAAVFPSAFYLVAPYTESLFLALAVWAFVFARRRRWLAAGVCAALGALTRSIGILVVIPLVLEAGRQRGHGEDPGARAWAAALLSAPAGLGMWLAYAWLRFGDALAPVQAQLRWERTGAWEAPEIIDKLTAPFTALVDAGRFATQTPGLYASGYHTMDVIVFIPIVVAVIWLFFRVPLPYAAFALANVVAWLLYPFPGRPLMSTFRFALAVAPLFWAFGAWTPRRGVATVWWSASAAMQGAMLLLLVNWYYVF